MNCVSTGRSTTIHSEPSTTAEQVCDAATAGGALLPDPLSELGQSGDVGAQIASLIVNMAREQKKAARDARVAAEAAQREAEEEELDAMNDKAAWKLGAGLIEGATKAVSGAIGIRGAGLEGPKAKCLEGTAKLVEAGGKMESTVFSFVADGKEVDAKRAEQYAARQKRAGDEQRNNERDAAALVDKALGYYKEYLTAKADTQRATLLRA